MCERGKHREGTVQRGRNTMGASVLGSGTPALMLVMEARRRDTNATAGCDNNVTAGHDNDVTVGRDDDATAGRQQQQQRGENDDYDNGATAMMGGDATTAGAAALQ